MTYPPDPPPSHDPPRSAAASDGDLTLHRLAEGEGEPFAGLTYPGLASLLHALPADHAAVGARSSGRPVGLALARLGPQGGADLLSLAVVADRRRQGIGRRLAEACAAVLRKRGATALSARITGHNPSRPALAAALRAVGWGPLACESIRVIGCPERMTRESLEWKGIGGRLLVQQTFSFDPWTDLRDRDRPAIEALAALSGLSQDLLRGIEAGNPDPRLSLVVRRRGEPVGGVMARRTASPLADRPDAPTVLYGPSFMHPAFASQGLLIGGFWHAFARQAEAMGPGSLAVYQTATPRMVALSRRRFAPMAIRSDEVFAAVRSLN